MRQMMAMALVGALALPVAGWAEGRAELTVTGVGEVELAPDMATLTLGVSEQGATAAEAMNQASTKIAAILAELSATGVAEKDLQTVGLTLDPVYEPVRNDVTRPPRVLGFEAGNTIQVTVRDLTALGRILDGVVENGANSFRGLSFGLQDPAEAQDQARRDAVADAVARATVIAEAAGAKPGAILSISEGGSGGFRPEFSARMAMADAKVIAPGSLSLSEQVTVVFELEQ